VGASDLRDTPGSGSAAYDRRAGKLRERKENVSKNCYIYLLFNPVTRLDVRRKNKRSSGQ